MSGFFIGEDGPHEGVVVSFEDGEEWLLGRDPDASVFVLEDPMVSRKHALIRLEDGLYILENLSTVNPIQVNGHPIDGPYQLQEDDSVQIGNNFFRFTTTHPDESEIERDVSRVEMPFSPPKKSSSGELSRLPFMTNNHSRWMIKVISGPNQGAEFSANPGESHVIGKDPAVSDIIFQDLSVSRQHAKIDFADSGLVQIEDLGSRNGVLVNGSRVEGFHELSSQDLVSMGTTSFLIIDREASQETIYSPSRFVDPDRELQRIPKQSHEESTSEKVEEPPSEEKDWKETFIPNRHLVIASIFSLVLFIGIVSFLALFRAQTVVVESHNPNEEIRKTIHHFPNVQFTFNPANGKIFLLGHVLTDIDHSELLYLINNLPFVESIENNVVIDEGVWESTNALLMKNPSWRGIMLTSTTPGHFVLRGYLETEEEAIALKDYMNVNFSYLNLLDNQVVVENTLQTQLRNLLFERGFVNVTFQLSGGEVIFAGRVSSSQENKFEDLLDQIEKIRGVQQVKNFVIFTGESTSRINLSSQYSVLGSSKFGAVSQYVLINGKILTKGDSLDGMTITGITSSEVQLDKDGVKYKIDYNMQ